MSGIYSNIRNRLSILYKKHPGTCLAGFYLLVSVIFGWELLAPGRSLYRWDTLLYNWPMILEARDQILAGHWPFWASSFCCGTPLLANITVGVLYPLRIVNWVLPLKAGYHLFLFLHLWLSLWGMHLFLRKGMRVGALAAFAGALAYGVGGYARSMWDTHNFMAMPWIPFAFLCLIHGRQVKLRWPAAAGTGVSWAMLILCGDFQAVCVWLPAAILLILFLPDRRPMAATLALAVPLGLLLAAPQWVPSVVSATESYRAGGLSLADILERSLNPLRLIEWMVPHAFGIRDSWFGVALAGEGARRGLPWTTSIHMGQILLIPAALAIARRRRRSAWVQWGLILFAFFTLLSFGRFLPGFSKLAMSPLFRSFRYPEKYILWSNFGFAVLAAQGVGALVGIWSHPRLTALRNKMICWWVLVLAGAGLLISTVLPQVASGKDGISRWLTGRWTALVVVFVIAAIAAAIGRRPATRKFVLGLLFTANLLLPWFLEYPTTSRSLVTDPPIVAKAIMAHADHTGRFFRDRSARGVPIPPEPADLRFTESATLIQQAMLELNSPRLWGLSSADGFSPLESRAMRDFRTKTVILEGDAIPDAPVLASFCRQAAVRWLLTSSTRARELEELGLSARKIEAWGPAGETVLMRFSDVAEAEIIPRIDQANPNRAKSAEVRHVWRERPGMIRVDLQPGGTCRLLVKETHAQGWRAVDNLGRPLAIRASPEGFSDVTVTPNAAQVRLRYVPKGWMLGCGLGLAGLVLLLAMFPVMLPLWLRGRSRSGAV